MALRAAVANGNWSNPATWNGGVLPSAGDIVASNNFVVTIDQNINVDRLINSSAISNGTVPLMTSNTMPSGIADQSSAYGNVDLAWKAFDQNNSTYWRSNFPSGWISYEFTSSKIITAYYFVNYQSNYGGNPKDWTFEGWNGSSWVVLHTVTNYPGNLTTYTSPDIGNTTSYIRYRLNISLTFASGTVIVNTLTLLDPLDFNGSTVAGGGFILNDGVTITCTNSTVGIIGNSSARDVVTYSGTLSASINAKIGVNAGKYSVLHNGTGTLNIVGDVVGQSIANLRAGGAISITTAGVINLVGDFYPPLTDTSAVIGISGGAIFNQTGSIIYVSASAFDRVPVVIGSSSRYNLTGNVDAGMRGITGACIATASGSIVNITGNVSAVRGRVIESTAPMTLTIVGSITSNSSTDTANINPPIFDNQQGSFIVFSGPFICGAWGTMPFDVKRVSLIPSSNSYFQFPNNSTNSANTPSPPAPTTRLVSPGSAVDAPTPANVRDGVVYALGSLTGTLKVPSPNSVAFGVPTDDTTGLAVLTPEDVWNAQTSAMNTAGSIGNRLKNTATVDSTGDQIAALL